MDQPLLSVQVSHSEISTGIQDQKMQSDDSHAVSLYFDKIFYSIPKPTQQNPNNELTIIHNMSGFVPAGTLMAIIGPSGAGKTTLLDVLACRKTTGKVTGDIQVNGEQIDIPHFRRISGYVLQNEVFFGSLTVEETLRFSALLRSPSNTTRTEIDRRVEAIMKQLALYDVRDSYIGTEFRRGISGGQKKRVAIAMELLTEPRLLFLDEPTSGLDSLNAFSLIYSLKNLARLGRTIICSIHQPNSDIFRLFDYVLVVTETGELGFFGPSKDGLSFFEQCGYTCDPQTNPADFYLNMVSLEKEGAKLPKELKVCNTSDEIRAIVAAYEKAKQEYVNIPVMRTGSRVSFSSHDLALVPVDVRPPMPKNPPTRLGFCSQFFILTQRSFLNAIRNPLETYMNFSAGAFFGLLIGSIYWQLDHTQKGINDRLGGLFFLAMNAAFSNIGSLEVFLLERAVFVHERANEMYFPVSYFLGKVLPDLPIRLIIPIVFGTIAYWMMGLHDTVLHFFYGVLLITLISLNSYAVCLATSCFAPNFAVANLAAPLWLVLMLIPSGFLISIDDIPVYWSWLKYISFFKYAYEALVINEFKDANFYCDPDEYTPPGCTGSSCICPETTGIQVINNLQMNSDNLSEDIGVLVAMIAAYLFIAFLCLKFLQKERR